MNQKTRMFFTRVLAVVASNMTTILSGIIVSFLIPQVLSMEDYGFYKTFTLYGSYIGLFSLGIIDGIVLRYGGNDYDKLGREKFRSYFDWYLVLNLLSIGLVSVLVLLFMEGEHRFIFLMFALNILPVNLTEYFQQISQITQRFKEYSARKIIQSACNILSVVTLFLLFLNGFSFRYYIYVLILVIVNYCLAAWYLFTYREIVFGRRDPFLPTFRAMRGLIWLGVPLLVSNLCTTLILNLDRQFVNILFSTTEYAVYAFAYNIISLITIATSAIATVVFPALMREKKEDVVSSYKSAVTYMLIFAYAAIASYFVFAFIIENFLSAYVGSIPIFAILFPGIAISTVITVIMHNYYKVLGKSSLFFIFSVSALAASFLANVIAYLTAGTTYAISVASVITIFLWYLLTETYFCRRCGYRRLRNVLYILTATAAFYLSIFIPSLLFGLLVYVAALAVITVLFHLPLLKDAAQRFLKRTPPTDEGQDA